MGTHEIQEMTAIQDLVSAAHREGEPVVVYDGDDECLVAMSPIVFERILLEGEALNSVDRSSLHI